MFGLVLLVRVLTKQSNHLIDVSPLVTIGVDYTTSVNYPFKITRGKQFDDFDDADSFMKADPNKVEGARVAIYYPTHISFKKYDMFVVMWNADGTHLKTIGYQLKEGKDIPADEAKHGYQIFCGQGKSSSGTKKNRKIKGIHK